MHAPRISTAGIFLRPLATSLRWFWVACRIQDGHNRIRVTIHRSECSVQYRLLCHFALIRPLALIPRHHPCRVHGRTVGLRVWIHLSMRVLILPRRVSLSVCLVKVPIERLDTSFLSLPTLLRALLHPLNILLLCLAIVTRAFLNNFTITWTLNRCFLPMLLMPLL